MYGRAHAVGLTGPRVAASSTADPDTAATEFRPAPRSRRLSDAGRSNGCPARRSRRRTTRRAPGRLHRRSTSCHDRPRSAERNSPPGNVPAQTVPCAASSRPDLHQLPRPGRWHQRAGPDSLASRPRASWAPASSEACSLTPECPRFSAASMRDCRLAGATACSPVRRGSCVREINQRPSCRGCNSNRPLRVGPRRGRGSCRVILRKGPATQALRLPGARVSARS